MPSSPDLVACVVDLAAREGTVLERSQGHRAHALFLSLIEATDPELSAQLHASAPVKPWTITPLHQQGRRLRHGDAYPLRVSFLQASLYLPFARAFLDTPNRSVRLADGEFSLQAIHTTCDSSHWAGVQSWRELINRAAPADELTLQFGSPTAFSLATDERGRKRYGLFPDGPTVFRSLLKRWNAFAPMPLDASILDEVDILTKQYTLQTEMLQFGKAPQLGFTGKVTYRVSGADVPRHLISALADAALYLGVGAKTTQGMGLVRRIR